VSRTTPERVRAAINLDVDAIPSLHGPIGTAHALTNYVDIQDSQGILTNDLLVEIETYLACHFCALVDQQFESKSVGDASGRFQTGEKGQGLLATDWGAQAVALDITGLLASLAKGHAIGVGINWLGTPVNQQTDYWDRN
jgi:hypothetical protein